MKKHLVLPALALLAFLSLGCASRVIVYEETSAPPARVEVIPARPCPKAVWVPGHWVWRGKYRGWVWYSGHWRR